MASFLNIARWEGFKLRHRRMPWVLLAILIAFTQLSVWGGYLSYQAAATRGGFVSIPAGVAGAARGMPRMIRCDDLRTKPTEVLPAAAPPQAAAMLLDQCQKQLATRYSMLSPIASTAAALGVVSFIGLVLLGILSASAFGAEFGLGTLRPILVRGVGRESYLGGKFLILAVAATVALLLAAAAAALSGALARSMAVPPPDAATAIAITGSWSDVMLTLVRVWATLLAFLTIASSITILTRSTAAGMAVSLGLFIFESLFIRLMTAAFDWFEQVGDYLPMHNLSALGKASFNLGPGAAGAAAAAAAGSTVSTTHASIVTALYVLAFGGAAVAVFRNRDVGGISGG